MDRVPQAHQASKQASKQASSGEYLTTYAHNHITTPVEPVHGQERWRSISSETTSCCLGRGFGSWPWAKVLAPVESEMTVPLLRSGQIFLAPAFSELPRELAGGHQDEARTKR